MAIKKNNSRRFVRRKIAFFFLAILLFIIISVITYFLLLKQGVGLKDRAFLTKKESPITMHSLQPEPTFVPLIYPSGMVFHSLFQKAIATSCKEVFTNQNSSMDYIPLDALPLKFDQKVIKIWHDPTYGDFIPYDTPTCTDLPNTDTVKIRLLNKQEMFIFDQYSIELGHGGYSFFHPIEEATKIVDKDGISLTFYLHLGMGSTIGEEAIIIRGIKTITLPNGEVIYVTLDTDAIDAKDPRLLNILDKYSIPSEYQASGFDVNYTTMAQYSQDIKNTFFADMNDLSEPEKSRIAQLLTTLSAVTAK